VELARAAAAHANFPPVFPNVAVDLTDVDQRHWITDGGATDNRGILSLLYALREALREETLRQEALREQRREFTSPESPAGEPEPQPDGGKSKLPEIHIVVAEASGAYLDYKHDRGAGALVMSKSRVASQLMIELMEDVQIEYDKLQEFMQPPKGGEDIHFRYLPMPSVLRMRGGLGTHWMLPSKVTLTNVVPPKQCKAHQETVEGETVAYIIRDLHRTDGGRYTPTDPKEAAKTEKIWRWIDHDPWIDSKEGYKKIWGEVVDALKGEVEYAD
jgi:hypothetical protein